MKLKAVLEQIRTRKNVSDDVIQTLVLTIYADCDQLGVLNTFYRKPLEITIEETRRNLEN